MDNSQSAFKKLLAVPPTFDTIDKLATMLRTLSEQEAAKYGALSEFTAWAMANRQAVEAWAMAQQAFKDTATTAAVPADLKDLYDMIIECGGAEIHRNDWPDAERLVASGHITLGGARGPGDNFRRAVLKGERQT